MANFLAQISHSTMKQPPLQVVIKDVNCNVTKLSAGEIQKAILAIVRDEITLILPERGRCAWPTKIVEIKSN